MTIFGLKKIFNYFSIFTIILGSAFGTFNSAHAGDGDDGTGEVVDGASITATDANGLLIDADGDGAIAISVDPNGGITFGTAGDDDAITSDSTGAAATTFTITDSNTTSIDTLTLAPWFFAQLNKLLLGENCSGEAIIRLNPNLTAA